MEEGQPIPQMGPEPLVTHPQRRQHEPRCKPPLYAEINSEWVMDLNVKNTAVKILGKKNRRKSLGYRAKQRVY